MRKGFLECERSIFVVSGRQGSGKSTLISTILKNGNIKATSAAFSDLPSCNVGDLHLVITDIAIPSSTKLRETLETLISSSKRLNTLILEVSLTSHELLSDLDFGQDHDISWYYTLSPSEISCPLTLPQHVTPVSIAFTHAREWQIAAHVLRAYHSTPDTFSDLSTFNLKDFTLLQNKEVFRILVTDFSGVSTRTLWYVVKMLCHVVKMTTQRMTDIQENFGKYLDFYTQNVGLMMANQVEQIIRMFSGEFDPSQMFAVFLKCATQWQQIECNRTSCPTTTCQAHLQKLISECSEHYYKHLDIDSRLLKDEDYMVTGALINLLGFEAEENGQDDEILTLGSGDTIILSPTFCVLLAQVIMKMEVDIPVILWGKEGSGKSTLVRCLQSLYMKCKKLCKVISHDPVLQKESELAMLLQSDSEHQSDIIIIVVQLSRLEDVPKVQAMITNKTVDGRLCPSNVKFVVEFTDESLKACLDPRNVIPVRFDLEIVKGLLVNLGIPSESNELLLPLLGNESVSYRNIINFAKVYSWTDQVFFSKHHHLLLSPSSSSNPVMSLKTACVLVLATETVFGVVSDELIDDIAKYYDLTSQLDVLLGFTLDCVAKALFKRSSSSTEVCRALFLTMVSLETHIPLVLNSNVIQSSLLQAVLRDDPILTAYNTNVGVVERSTPPHGVLQCYWTCLKEFVTSLSEGGPTQHGMVLYDGYSTEQSTVTRRVISELVKCKPVRPLTPDISLIILVPEGAAPRELGCCLLGAGVEFEQQPLLGSGTCDSDQNQNDSHSESGVMAQSDDHILPITEPERADIQGNGDVEPFSLIKWIKKRVHISDDNLQNIASAVLIMKLLLKNTDPNEELLTRLEKIVEMWGEVLPYICKIPPSLVERTSQLVKVTESNLVTQLIEIRLGDLCCKQIISWDNAYSFYTEIKILISYTSSDNLRAVIQSVLWFCEMSSIFCKVKDASLSQYLRVVSDLTLGKDRSFSNFTSWADYQGDNKILVYSLILLLRDKRLLLSDLMGVISGVVHTVASVEILCVLLRKLVRTYGVDTLDKICDNIDYTPSNSAIISALVCVYQEEVEKLIPLETVPDTVTIKSIALVRQTVLHCSHLLVDFYNDSNGKIKSDVDVEEYFKDKDSASNFSILMRLISEAANSAIKQFILKHLLEKCGTECLKYLLSVLPALQHDTVSSEDVLDVNEVIAGYKDIKDKVYPICTFCCRTNEDHQLDVGPVSLVYYEVYRQSNVLQCDCLVKSLPPQMISVFNAFNSCNMGVHGRISVYLASQLITSGGNPFMGYFLELLTGSDLDNIYWMGMPHDDLFEIINTVKPSEKYADVEKAYTWYQCPRGHVYSINNCGDPLQREKCPECKEVIGGRDHIAAEQNSKYDTNQKAMIETGYTMNREKFPEFRPGRSNIRELSQLATAVLWYFTHAILSLRDDPYVPSNDPSFDLKERLDEAFAGILETLQVSPDVTIMFLLDAVSKLSAYSTPELHYKSEIVHDSLKPQDILIMKKLEDLKSCRSRWESEFSVAIAQIKESSSVLTEGFLNTGLSSAEHISHTDNAAENSAVDMNSLGNPCYWITEGTVKNPFSSIYSDSSRLSSVDEEKKNQLRLFADKRQQLHLIQHVPFLLNLLKDLKHLLNYKLDFGSLLQSATFHITESDIKKWYDIWCELDGLWDVSQLRYSARELKPVNELTLFDIAPTNYQFGSEVGRDIPSNCQSGSVTLNMLKYLSMLQNSFVPGKNVVSKEKHRYIQFDIESETALSFLCEKQGHLSNYVQFHLLGPITRLPTDHDVHLQSLSSRILYFDQDGQDFQNIVKFYNSLENHLELESSEVQIVEGLEGCDLWYCHQLLTGMMAGLAAGAVVLEEISLPHDMAFKVGQLLSWTDKLFAFFRHVNLLCVRSTLLKETPESDFLLNKLLFSFFSSDLYNSSCLTPELSEDHQSLQSILAEYVSLRMLHLDPPDLFKGWELEEALEFYFENFKGRASSITMLAIEGIKVDHIGHLLHALVRA